MNTVNSLLSKNNPSPILNEQTLPIKKEYTDDVTAVSYDVISNDESKMNTINKQSTEPKITPPRRYTIVSYGPINVKVKLHEAPTLKTGRRSRYIQLEGDEAKKRELRRKKNRELARKLKEKRTIIENQLLKEINELESHEQNLIDEVRNLQSYKQFLENRYQQKFHQQNK